MTEAGYLKSFLCHDSRQCHTSFGRPRVLS